MKVFAVLPGQHGEEIQSETLSSPLGPLPLVRSKAIWASWEQK